MWSKIALNLSINAAIPAEIYIINSEEVKAGLFVNFQ